MCLHASSVASRGHGTPLPRAIYVALRYSVVRIVMNSWSVEAANRLVLNRHSAIPPIQVDLYKNKGLAFAPQPCANVNGGCV